MERQKLSKQQSLALFIVFTAGWFLHGFFNGPQTKEVAAQCNYENWKTLKEKDDEALIVAGSGYAVCADIIGAAVSYDITGMQAGAAKITNLTEKLKKIGNERLTILVKLGY